MGVPAYLWSSGHVTMPSTAAVVAHLILASQGEPYSVSLLLGVAGVAILWRRAIFVGVGAEG